MSETTARQDVRAWLERVEKANPARSVAFWERCGCLAGLGEIPSVSDCHQAGLCQMREREHQRDRDTLALIAAVRAALDLTDELEGRVRVLERAAYTSDFVQGQMDAYREQAARIRRALTDAAGDVR